MSFKQSHHKFKDAEEIEVVFFYPVDRFDFKGLKNKSNKKQPFHWVIQDSKNNKILASSETYANQEDAEHIVKELVDVYFEGLNQEDKLLKQFSNYIKVNDKIILILTICWLVVAMSCLLAIFL